MSVQLNRPTDYEPITNWPSYIREIAEQVVSNMAAIGGDFTRTVEVKSASETLSIADLNRVLLADSTSEILLGLPAVTVDDVGKFLRIHKWNSGNVVVVAGGADTIANGVAGTRISNTMGSDESQVSMLDLEVVASGKWAIVGMFGTWDIV